MKGFIKRLFGRHSSRVGRKNKANPTRRRIRTLEALEERRQLACDIFVYQGTLHIQGGDFNDYILVEPYDDGARIFAQVWSSRDENGGFEQYCWFDLSADAVDQIAIEGFSGQDEIYNLTAIPAEIIQAAPINDAPVDDAPVDDAPVDDAPVDDAPVDDAPVDDAPVDDAPVDDAPVDDAPVDDAPVDDAPVDDAPVDDAPVDDAPVDDAPVDDAPVDDVPVDDVPVDDVPVDDVPVDDVPVDDVPVDDVPVDDVPVDDVPVDDVPVDDVPVDDVPVDDVPVDDVPVDDVPVDEAPPQDLNGDIVSISEGYLGQQIGDGECWTSVVQILNDAGADTSGALNDDFGDPIGLNEIKAGDVLQFYDATVEWTDENGWTHFHTYSPRHTAIVYSVEGTRITLINSNIGGDRTVQFTVIDLGGMQTGEIYAYRPLYA